MHSDKKFRPESFFDCPNEASKQKITNIAASFLKFVYSEKATQFCEISNLLSSYVVPVKSKVEILQNFVAF